MRYTVSDMRSKIGNRISDIKSVAGRTRPVVEVNNFDGPNDFTLEATIFESFAWSFPKLKGGCFCNLTLMQFCL